MNSKLILCLPNLVVLQIFSVFPEYFLCISAIYILIVIALMTYSICGLMIQKALSECFFLILLMVSFLIINDDLLLLNFLNFNNSFLNDYFSFFIKLIICLFSSCYFLIIANSLKEQKLTSFEYLLIIVFAVLSFLILCSSNDLLIAYLGIELFSLAFYILASFRKVSTYSIESGIKYFVTGAVSSSFFLLGSSFFYCFTGSINFSDFGNLFECSSIYFFHESVCNYWDFEVKKFPKIIFTLIILNWVNTNWFLTFNELFNYSFLEFGLILVLFSLFIKLALAPFNLWSLDVYEGSPTTSTFFFSTITKLSLFVLLIRICYQSFFSLKNCWQSYSIWVGTISIFVGSFGGFKQRKLKTLLAYSSTSHMGHLLIAFSTSTFTGIQMLLFYILIYMISSLSIWYIILLLRLKKQNFTNKYSKELSELSLLKKSNPALSFSLSLTIFSIAGIPPLVGFLAKISIFLSVTGISFYFVAATTIFCSVVSTFYYIRIVKVLYFENVLVGKLYYPSV